MSVIPVSSLSVRDLRSLGNNLRPRNLTTVKLSTGRVEKAVNRSLARLGERVKRLESRPFTP